MSLILLLSAAGCCTWEYSELDDIEQRARKGDPEAQDDWRKRRQALACLAEDAEEDPGLRTKVLAKATLWTSSKLEADPSVRATALRVLAHLRGTGSIAAILTCLQQDPNPAVRMEAVATLAQLGGEPLAVDPLLATLSKDSDADVRMAAARELGNMKVRKPLVVTTLVRTMRHPSVGVRLHARRALRLLYPKVDKGLSPQAWQGWLIDMRAAQDEKAVKEAYEKAPPKKAPRKADPDLAPKEEDYDFPDEDPFEDEEQPKKKKDAPKKKAPKKKADAPQKKKTADAPQAPKKGDESE